MQTSYLFYITGVLLLTLPTGLFIRNRFKIATLPEIADRPRLRFGWLHPYNAIDLVRAYAGMSLLIASFAAIAPSAPGMLLSRVVLAVTALVGLLMQHAFHKSEEGELPTPVAYVFGLTFAILPVHVALLALPIGIATAIAIQSLGFGLILAAAATALLGKLFGQSIVVVGTASMLLFLPVLVAALFRRSLGLTVRRGPVVRHGSFREVPVTVSR